MFLLSESANSSESIDKEKYEVKDSGEKIMNGRLCKANKRKRALNTNPPSIPLLYVSLLTLIFS